MNKILLKSKNIYFFFINPLWDLIITRELWKICIPTGTKFCPCWTIGRIKAGFYIESEVLQNCVTSLKDCNSLICKGGEIHYWNWQISTTGVNFKFVLELLWFFFGGGGGGAGNLQKHCLLIFYYYFFT